MGLTQKCEVLAGWQLSCAMDKEAMYYDGESILVNAGVKRCYKRLAGGFYIINVGMQ
jgi:hypothetical protein